MISGTPQVLPRWRSIFWPFGLDMWMAVLASIPFYSAIFYFFVVLKNHDASDLELDISLLESVVSTAGLLIGIGEIYQSYGDFHLVGNAFF